LWSNKHQGCDCHVGVTATATVACSHVRVRTR
jgi:hypothetical protein